MEEDNIIWLKKTDFLKNESKLLLLFYYLGIYEFKDISDRARGRKLSPDNTQILTPFKEYYAWFGPRWWNPLTFVVIAIIILIGIIEEIFKSIVKVIREVPEALTVEIHTYKKTKSK